MKAFIKKNPTTTALIAGPAIGLLVYGLQSFSSKPSEDQSSSDTEQASEMSKNGASAHSTAVIEWDGSVNTVKTSEMSENDTSGYDDGFSDTNKASEEFKNNTIKRSEASTRTPSQSSKDDLHLLSTCRRYWRKLENCDVRQFEELTPDSTRRRFLRARLKTPVRSLFPSSSPLSTASTPLTDDSYSSIFLVTLGDQKNLLPPEVQEKDFDTRSETGEVKKSSSKTSRKRRRVIEDYYNSNLFDSGVKPSDLSNSFFSVKPAKVPKHFYNLPESKVEFHIGRSSLQEKTRPSLIPVRNDCIKNSSKHKKRPSKIPVRCKENKHILEVFEKERKSTLKEVCEAALKKNTLIDEKKYKALVTSLRNKVRETHQEAIESIVAWHKSWGYRRRLVSAVNIQLYADSFQKFFNALSSLVCFFNPHAPKDTYEIQYKSLIDIFTTLSSNQTYLTLCSLENRQKDSQDLENSYCMVPHEDFTPVSDSEEIITFQPYGHTATKDSINHLIDLLDTTTRVFFLEIDISQEADEWMRDYIGGGYRSFLGKENDKENAFCNSESRYFLPHHDIKETLKADFFVLDSLYPADGIIDWFEKKYNMFKGHFDFCWSPFHISNFAHQVLSFTVKNKPVKVIRMGCPTISEDVCSVLPIFENFIRLYQKDGKKHLYINLQNNDEKSQIPVFNSFIGDERRRIAAIEHCAGKYPEALIHCIFPMDNSLWKLGVNSKANQYPGTIDFNSFKEAFFKSFITQRGEGDSFHYPDLPFQDEGVHQVLFESIFQLIKTHLLESSLENNGGFFTKEAIKELSFIFYVSIARSFIKLYKVDSCNFTCKDGIDRGGSFNVIFICLELIHKKATRIRQQHENNRDTILSNLNLKIRLLVNQFSFLVKKQPIIETRRQHLLDTLDFIFKYPMCVINYLEALDNLDWDFPSYAPERG